MGQLEAENQRLRERLDRIKDWVWAEFKVTIPKYIWLGDQEEEEEELLEEYLDDEPSNRDLVDPLDLDDNESFIKEETPSTPPNVTTTLDPQGAQQPPPRTLLKKSHTLSLGGLPQPSPQQGSSRLAIIQRIRPPQNKRRLLTRPLGSKRGHPRPEDLLCQVCGVTFPQNILLKQHYAIHLDPKGKDYSAEFDRTCPLDIRVFLERTKKAARERDIKRLTNWQEFQRRLSERNLEEEGAEEADPTALENLDHVPLISGEPSQLKPPKEEATNNDLPEEPQPMVMTKPPPKVDYYIPLRRRDPICPICHRRFKSFYNVISHQKVHQARELVPCPIQGCLRKLLSDRLDLHMERVHCNVKFKCHHEGCNRSFSSNSILKKHFKIKHLNQKPPPKLFKCSIKGCQKTFITELGTKEHGKSHLPENQKELNCPTCHKEFTNEPAYMDHIKYNHRTDPHPFVCDFEGCGKGFYRRRVFNTHKKCHTKEAKMEYEASRIPCPHCGLMTGRSRMKIHIRIKHEKELKFICEHCGRGYPIMDQLKQHYAVHLNPNGPEYSEEFDKTCPEDIRKLIERGKAARQRYFEKTKKLKK